MVETATTQGGPEIMGRVLAVRQVLGPGNRELYPRLT